MASLQTTVACVSATTSCFVASDSARQLLASSSASLPVTKVGASQFPSVRCGRGDKRTAKGKRFRGSFGNSRPKDANKSRGLGITPLPPRPPKKEPEVEFVQVDLDESLFTS